jgi:hypothetical protein
VISKRLPGHRRTRVCLRPARDMAAAYDRTHSCHNGCSTIGSMRSGAVYCTCSRFVRAVRYLVDSAGVIGVRSSDCRAVACIRLPLRSRKLHRGALRSCTTLQHCRAHPATGRSNRVTSARALPLGNAMTPAYLLHRYRSVGGPIPTAVINCAQLCTQRPSAVVTCQLHCMTTNHLPASADNVFIPAAALRTLHSAADEGVRRVFVMTRCLWGTQWRLQTSVCRPTPSNAVLNCTHSEIPERSRRHVRCTALTALSFEPQFQESSTDNAAIPPTSPDATSCSCEEGMSKPHRHHDALPLGERDDLPVMLLGGSTNAVLHLIAMAHSDITLTSTTSSASLTVLLLRGSQALRCAFIHKRKPLCSVCVCMWAFYISAVYDGH